MKTSIIPRNLLTINGNIIIVQDNPIERRYYVSIVSQQLDYKIITYSSGEELLDRLNYCCPKLIITDYHLDYFHDDNVMSGLQLTRRLKKAIPKIPIIMISKYGNELIDEAIEDGVDSFIEKVDGHSKHLLNVVRKLLKIV